MNALQKYEARVDAIDSLLCVGLDPEFARLPARFRSAAHSQFEFSKHIIEATHVHTASYKLNIAFFEARGVRGLEDLELTTAYLRSHHPNILLLCDAKYGDILNTNVQSASVPFDCFGFDGVTVHPYMGFAALAPFLERRDKAIIVLCRTINSGGSEIQTLTVEGKPLWQVVAEKVCCEWNKFGNCMLVIGAMEEAEIRKARVLAGDMTFLVPGVGAQGGDLEAAVNGGLNAQGKGLIIVAARSIIFAEDPGRTARELRERINRARELRARAAQRN
jgi:orotidine-5'-phosphate decarboxylase